MLKQENIGDDQRLESGSRQRHPWRAEREGASQRSQPLRREELKKAGSLAVE